MRPKNLERYRSAAVVIRAFGLPVTSERLAQARACSVATVQSALKKKPWHREYIGCLRKNELIEQEYIRAAQSLSDKGEVVTCKKLAQIRRVALVTVHKFFEDRPKLAAQLGLQIGTDVLSTEYRAAAQRIVIQKKPVTRKLLAFELKKPYKTVCTFLTNNPEFARTIGVSYTYQASNRRTKR